jgi:hypothetical protein
MSDEDRAAIRGQKKLQSISQAVQPLMAQAKTDPTIRERISKMSETLDNDPDHQALVAKLGFDEMKYTMDQETGEGTYTLAKNWTKDELESYADKAPNGQTLLPFANHPGKYRITFDDVGAVTGVEMMQTEKLGKKTHEEMIDLSLHGSPVERKQARENLAAEAEFKKTTAAATAAAGGTGLSQDAVELEAERVVAGEKVGNYGYGKQGASMRAVVLNRAAQIAKTRGMDASAIIAQGAELAGEKGGMKDLVKRETLIGTFVNRIDATSDVVLKLAEKVNNKDSRLANVPINRVRSMLGSGDLQSLDLALTSLSNEIAKVESGSIGIAGVSIDQAKIMARIHDRNLSLNDLKKVIETGKMLGKTSMDSIRKQRKGLKADIAGNPAQAEPSGDDPLGLR